MVSHVDEVIFWAWREFGCVSGFLRWVHMCSSMSNMFGSFILMAEMLWRSLLAWMFSLVFG